MQPDSCLMVTYDNAQSLDGAFFSGSHFMAVDNRAVVNGGGDDIRTFIGSFGAAKIASARYVLGNTKVPGNSHIVNNANAGLALDGDRIIGPCLVQKLQK